MKIIFRIVIKGIGNRKSGLYTMYNTDRHNELCCYLIPLKKSVKQRLKKVLSLIPRVLIGSSLRFLFILITVVIASADAILMG